MTFNKIIRNFIKEEQIDIGELCFRDTVKSHQINNIIKGIYSDTSVMSIKVANIAFDALEADVHITIKRYGNVLIEETIDTHHNNYLKMFLKRILVNEGIRIEDHMHKVSKSRGYDMVKKLQMDTFMQMETFERWCDILDLEVDFKVTKKESATV